MQSQVKRRIAFGLTTGGLIAGGGLGFAHADAGGTGSGTTGTTAGGSPGVLSGNSVQVPVDVPINVCGVTANVVGLLNTAAHNQCSNSGGAIAGGGSGTGSGTGTTGGSPGVLSGNNVQIPVNVPVNVCGDSVSGVGVGDAALHNGCANHGSATATGGSGTGGSPGVLSGNNVQVPVHIPVNACGDTVSVVGVGDAAKHNKCADHGGATATGGAGGGNGTGVTAGGSPGVLSGNSVQIPIDIPINVCGDSVSVLGIGDTAKHNACENHGGATASPPSTTPTTPCSCTPPLLPPTWPSGNHPRSSGGSTPGSLGNEPPPASTGALAHTGADGLVLAPIGAAMIGAGAFLYRKSKPKGRH